MLIKKIELSNWRTHRKFEKEFSDDLNIIIGPCGSGKTSIFEAIYYALSGKTPPRASSLKSLINKEHPNSTAIVSLYVQENEKTYKITRYISPNGSQAKIEEKLNAGYKLITASRVSDADEFIRNTFKISPQYLDIIFSFQNELEKIIDMTPAERKKKIDELIGLNELEEYRQKVHKYRNYLKKDIESSENALRLFLSKKGYKSYKHMVELNSNYAKEVKNLEEKLKNLNETYKEISEQIENIKDKISKMELYKEKYESIIQEIKKLEGIRIQLENDLKNVDIKDISKEEVESELQKLKEEKNHIEIELDRKKELEKRMFYYQNIIDSFREIEFNVEDYKKVEKEYYETKEKLENLKDIYNEEIKKKHYMKNIKKI